MVAESRLNFSYFTRNLLGERGVDLGSFLEVPRGRNSGSIRRLSKSSESMAPLPSEDCGATADAAFKLAVEHKIVIIYNRKDQESTELIDYFKHQSLVSYSLHVSDKAATQVLHIVQRDKLPIVFIKGDCVGGLTHIKELEKKNVLSSWLNDHDYDLAVIGGGSGGLAAAKEAARLNKKVIVFDFVKPSTKGTVWGIGGTCVNVGCIPKKLMHQAALLGESIRDARKFGWEIPEQKISLDWNKLKNAVQDHIASLNWNHRVQLRQNSVTYSNSYAAFSGPHEIQATNKKGKVEKITADRFLISTGLRPRIPDVPGAKECCISSDDLFSLPYNPGKTLCVGASYVSLECAGFLKGIGNDVTVMVRSILLRGFDRDMTERIRSVMMEKGIKFINAVPFKYECIEEVSENKPGLIRVYTEHFLDGGLIETVTEDFNTVLMAIGRDAITDGMCLERVNVARSQSKKIIGRREQTSCPYIYAIGDILNGTPELTPVAIQAGRVLMRRLYTGNMELTEYNNVPTTVFTPIEYGSCGETEEGAIMKYGKDNINIYHSVFIPLECKLSGGMEENSCYCKLICLKDQSDIVIGFHILSPNAGEITQGFAIAFKLGAKKSDFDRLIGIHPTAAENLTTLTTLKVEGQELKVSGC